ncbi:translation initiation factor IF-2-like [Bubalus bubalis]|uniref:translation initiation factor IF-2-like n=1 Tax=Bubalus bubalis TaxID=89462 RepID=UPI000DBC9871|nr:translation initiation factor IF-2-like [Bubalus bubalis]
MRRAIPGARDRPPTRGVRASQSPAPAFGPWPGTYPRARPRCSPRAAPASPRSPRSSALTGRGLAAARARSRSPPQRCLIRVGAGSAPAPAPRASRTRTFRRRRRWAAAEGEGGGGGSLGPQVERRPRVPACRSEPLPAPPPSCRGRGERLAAPEPLPDRPLPARRCRHLPRGLLSCGTLPEDAAPQTSSPRAHWGDPLPGNPGRPIAAPSRERSGGRTAPSRNTKKLYQEGNVIIAPGHPPTLHQQNFHN